MFKRVSDMFAGIKITGLSGVFLAFSLILLLTETRLLIDPAWVTVVLSGYPLLYLAMTRLIKEKRISSALLISIAMLASLGIGELFAAGEVAFIMAIGAILEDMTVSRAKKGLKNLIALTPTMGRRLMRQNDAVLEEIVHAEKIRRGDLLRILPGEAIPVDGIIVFGDTSVNQSIMTGESLPVDKKAGDALFCGTMNFFGVVDMEATAVGEDSSLQKLIGMVREAEDKKAPMQRIVDKWAVWLVPMALAIAAGTFVTAWAMDNAFMVSLNRAVTVLVVFCPCALALATPTSIMAAIGQAAKHGVIIKSGEALEKMGRVDTIAFDKTGTLTNGKLVVTDIHALIEDMDTERLLGLAASAEVYSEHPMAKAIVAHAHTLQIPLVPADNFQMHPGKGITATLNGELLLCGTLRFINEKKVYIDDSVVITLNRFRSQGKAIILIVKGQSLIGVITLSDTLREAVPEMVKDLEGMNTQVVLLTGDHVQTAKYFASKAGINYVKAELLPEDKVSSIKELEQQGHKVCMIGDGVNDAPALKAADVGVAMGKMGSDITVDAADIALMSDDISKIPYLRRLSRSTVRTIQGNIAVSMLINAVAIALSVLGILNPVTGALVHNAGSVLIVLNAALLYDRKFDEGSI